MMSKPPEFLDLDKMKVEVIGEEKEMQKFLSYTSTLNSRPFKLTGLSALNQDKNLIWPIKLADKDRH